MEILVTNDDGIHSPGLSALVEAVSVLGNVVVVAPDREKSACSHSLTLMKPLRIREAGENWFAVEGTPADCVNVAINGLLPGWRPDLVVSGINLGGNLGDDIAYSGTVAAAEEAAILHVPSMAVSINARSDCHFEVAGEYARRLAVMLTENGITPDTFFNMNIPNLPLEEIQGVQWTRTGRRVYGDVLEKRLDPRGEAYFWIGGQQPGMVESPGSDMTALNNGFISVTPITLHRTDESLLRKFMQEKRTI